MKHNEIILTNQAHPRLTANTATSTSNGTAILYVDTGSGYIELGPANGSHCHIQTDRSNFYFNKELRVNSGIVGSYDEDLILRRANSSSHQMVIDTTEVSTPLNLDVEGIIEFTSHSHQLRSERAQNAELRTGTAGAGGVLFRNSSGGFLAQLYGDGTNYGFLDGVWSGWDLKKTTNGKLTFNGNDTYFLQPEAGDSAKFFRYVQIGDSSSYNSNSGTWGARLNVTDDVHAKIEVGQDADSMLSHWYAHTGHTAIKFGTSSAHNVDLQRAGSTSIQIQAGGILFYVPIRRNSHHASGFLEGSYNNVGANGQKTNPIYTIGSSYNPNETSLNNMYGIGFARSDASYLTSFTGSSGNTWGMYVAGDGNARIWLDAQEGQVFTSSGYRVGNTEVIDSSRNLVNIGNITAGQLTVGGNIFNNSNSSYDIGQSNLRFNKLYIQNTIDSKGAFASYGTDTSYGVVRITHPDGADRHSRSSSETGAIKIVLPVSWTNTMMRMTIQVYEYSTDRSFTLYCGGYNYSGSSAWINTFAQIISSGNVVRDFNVRFGHDGSKCCIYIGELTSTWSYPQVTVTDFQGGFSAATTDNWDNDWDITLEASAFQNVNRTISTADTGRHHSDVYVNGSEVISNGRVLQNVTLKHGGGGARFETNNWHESSEGYDRFYFEASNRTFYRGTGHHFRNNSNVTALNISGSGGINVAGGDTHAASDAVLAYAGTTVIDTSRNGTFAGLTVDGGTSTTLTVKCDDGGNAIVRAGGDNQGTGVFEVTQDGSYGGGISYNGDSNPGWASGETSDHITFYRMDAGTRTEVFHYPYSSNVVNFNATPTVSGSTVWHAGNDGPSSGLDADTVDGIEAASTLHKLNNSGYYRPNTWIDFRDSGTAGLYWGSGSAAGWHINPTNTGKLKLRSGDSSYVQIDLTCNNDTLRGALYANNSSDVGILDDSGHWAIRHINHSGTQFRQANTVIASIGAGQVSGSFGSMVVNELKNGYGGYSINNRVVFMHDNSNTSGIYNDVNNHWMVRTINGGEVELFHNGTAKFQTTGDGILVSGMLRGGIGAATTSGTADWNHSTNARSGQGYTLLFGDATNGPHSGQSGKYYHPFSFEYSSKDGTGNLCQFAIPYAHNDFGPYFRTRYSGTWSGWVELWHSGNDGDGSGLDADLLDGVHKSSFVRTDQSSTILSGNSLNFQTSSGNTRGIINASETAPHLRIATSGNESIGFYDGGTSGTLNVEISGAGDLDLKTGNLNINGTTVIDSSRRIKNITEGSESAPGLYFGYDNDTGLYAGSMSDVNALYVTSLGSKVQRWGNGHTKMYGRVQLEATTNATASTPSMTSRQSSDTNGSTRYHINFTKLDNTVLGRITTNNYATTYTETSDYRLKENVNYTWTATDRVKQLRPCQYNWISDPDDTTVDGFLAHEVADVAPQAVVGEKDAVDSEGNIDPQGVDNSKLVPLLVKTIQELEARIAALENA